MSKYFINKVSIDLNQTESCGFSPITFAVRENNIALVIYLMIKGADIKIKDSNGCSLAHWAAYRNNLFLLKLFYMNDVDIFSLDNSGMSPLKRAIKN